jgi:hypothetical protein
MTDAVLPPFGRVRREPAPVPPAAPDAPVAPAVARPRDLVAAVPVAATAAPRSTFPAHLWVVAAASVAGYAVCLAGVTGLQSASEAQLAAERAPLVDDLTAIQSGHDGLVSRLDAAAASYASAASAFDRASLSLTDYQAALAALTATVGEIDGVSRSMPTSYTPPKVTRSVSTSSVPASTTTGGSAPKP